MKRVLLVDHDESFRLVYTHLLSQSGYEVVPCADADAAIQALDVGSMDAIITEVLLPGKNGLKLIQDIRLRADWLDIPILILTTLEPADASLPSSLMTALGVRAYLVKHQTRPDQVSEALQVLLPTA